MKFVIDKNKIQKILKEVKFFVYRKKTAYSDDDIMLNNIFTKIRIESKIIKDDEFIIITGNNGNTLYKAKINCKVYEEGSLLVDHKKLLNIIDCFPYINMVFETDKKNIIIKIKSEDDKEFKILFKLYILSESYMLSDEKYMEYESFDENYKHIFELENYKFINKIKRVVSFVDDYDDSYKRILFEKDGNNLNLVATNGKCLSFKSIEDCFLNDNNKEIFQILVSKDIFNDTKWLGNESKNFKVSISNSTIKFEIDNIIIKSNILNDNIPYYKFMLKDKYRNSFIVKSYELIESLNRLNVFKHGRKEVDFSNYCFFDFNKNKLNIEFENNYTENYNEYDQYNNYSGTKSKSFNDNFTDSVECESEDKLEIAFDYKLFLKVLNSLSSNDKIIIKTEGNKDPVIFERIEDEEVENKNKEFCVLAPMRIRKYDKK